MANKVTDFRSAVELLETIPGQLVTTDVEVEPRAQLACTAISVRVAPLCVRPKRVRR